MATSAPAPLLTAEQFAEMNFDGVVELVCGEIVEMTRPDQVHGSVCARAALALMQWAIPHRRGEVTINDSGILTERNPDTLRGAEVAFFAISQLPGGKLPRGLTSITPALCVEVLSPSNSWTEMRRKIEEYLAVGVREVWIVDPDARTVETFRSDAPSVLLHESQLVTSRELPEFSVPVSELFVGIE